MWKSKYPKHVTIIAQRNGNSTMEGNCSNAKEIVVSINTTCKDKQTTKRERETNMQKHTTQKKYYEKNVAQAWPWAPL